MARPVKRVYRTMQGRMIDIEKLRAANETAPAVGNMGVNARGDSLGPGGKIIKTKQQHMREYYEAPKGRAMDTPKKKMAPQPQPDQPPVVQTKTLDLTPPAPKPVQTQATPKPKPQQESGIEEALKDLD